MHRSEPGHAARIVRFGWFARSAHWVHAVVLLTLLGTGLTLYGFPGTAWVGHRRVVKDVHLWSGWALVGVLVIAFGAPAGREIRRDARRIARWSADDTRWWRRSTRAGARIGKFNPGQKLNTLLSVGSAPVMVVTGLLMRYPDLAPLRLRTGADVTHRWFALGLLALVVGHVVVSLAHPEAMRGIVTGRVRASWARSHHPRWFAEVETETGSGGSVRHS
jgi:formate dehydrogenase gamma subunit